ncbi:MAG TPA: class I SAM-dependent methyltransferase [Verrucomicrobiae bacterium]|jgi:SAM-dependent methyltransferase
MAAPASNQRPNYGIDAPDVVRRFVMIGVACLALAAGLKFSRFSWRETATWPAASIGVCFFLEALVMLWGSKSGKLRLRDKLIAAIPWRGDEQVLDVGCGHGLMLIGAAKQLRAGRAIGLDLWQKHVREYAKTLGQAGLSGIKISAPNFLFVIPSLTLTANKIVGNRAG